MTSVVGFIAAAIMLVVFALFCSARIGYYLLIVLVLAPVFSALITRIIAGMIEIKLTTSATIVSKNNHLEIKLNIYNRSIIPTSEILLELENNLNFEFEDKAVGLVMLPRESREIVIKALGNVAGGSLLSVKKAYIKGYFGFYKRELRVDNNEIRLGVIPDIAKISKLDEYINNAANAALDDENFDESTDESTLVFGGFPGYEYREYRPGDPLKRVNSKLSAKRDIMMVRLDEKQVLSRVTVILDTVSEYDKDSPQFVKENALENFLGIAKELINRDFMVLAMVRLDGLFQTIELAKEEDVFIFSKSLADYIFVENVLEDIERIPDISQIQTSSVIYVTPFVSLKALDNIDWMRTKGAKSVCVYEASAHYDN